MHHPTHPVVLIERHSARTACQCHVKQRAHIDCTDNSLQLPQQSQSSAPPDEPLDTLLDLDFSVGDMEYCCPEMSAMEYDYM